MRSAGWRAHPLKPVPSYARSSRSRVAPAAAPARSTPGRTVGSTPGSVDSPTPGSAVGAAVGSVAGAVTGHHASRRHRTGRRAVRPAPGLA
ncbi:glycine zipper domain-containing protein [Cellulomonas fimi]|uniref:glycine zipper domain-containing protein n=1 Tax=Cellulomonas fimi TaxID=1708 RepID=UPI003C6BEA3A